MHLEKLERLGVLYMQGDRLPKIQGAIEDVDLTGHTVMLHLLRPTTVLVKNATLTDAVNGLFEFAWATGDLVAGVGQEASLRLQNPSGLVQTLGRFLIDVLELPV
jgi:hypothetical protein